MTEAPEKQSQDWPFDIWLRLAVLHMGLSTEQFWDMDVRDWFVLCHRPEQAQFGQEDLSKLIKAYPDVTIQKKDI